MTLIAMHHRMELLFSLHANTLIVAIPVLSAGLVILWHKEKARKFHMEKVDWWTLAFFMLLFANAGALKYSGITNALASKLLHGIHEGYLLPTVLWTSAIGSSILDNVVLVAAYIPMLSSLKDIGANISNLWWALLFGGCLGGNITMVSSTANIIAIGMLE